MCIKNVIPILAFVVALPVCCSATDVGVARLLMFEEDDCVYCYRWHRDLEEAYINSEEGRVAVLEVHRLHAPLPRGVQTIRGAVDYSPTFMLVYDGKEVGRMIGYQGDEFFWVQLQQIFKLLPNDVGYRPEIN